MPLTKCVNTLDSLGHQTVDVDLLVVSVTTLSQTQPSGLFLPDPHLPTVSPYSTIVPHSGPYFRLRFPISWSLWSRIPVLLYLQD